MTVHGNIANHTACTAKAPAHMDTAVVHGWDENDDFNASLPAHGDGTFNPNHHIGFHLPVGFVTEHPLDFSQAVFSLHSSKPVFTNMYAAQNYQTVLHTNACMV